MNLMDTLRRIIEDPYVVYRQTGYIGIEAEGDSSLTSKAYVNLNGYVTQSAQKYQGSQYPTLVIWFNFDSTNNSKKIISQLILLGILYRIKRNYSSSGNKFKHGEVIDAIADMVIKTNAKLESLCKQLGCEFTPLKVNLNTYKCAFDPDFESYVSVKYLSSNCVSFEKAWPDRDVVILFEPFKGESEYSASVMNAYFDVLEHSIHYICEDRGYNFDRILSIAKILSVD